MKRPIDTQRLAERGAVGGIVAARNVAVAIERLPAPVALRPLPAPLQAIRPSVSVIIPVYNDATRLRHALAALRRQSYPRDRFDVIVVDNGSRDDITAVARDFPEVRIVEERRPGSYAARNKGLSVATGSVIAFTDADCVPHPTWLQNGVAALFRMPNTGLVGGAVEFVYDAWDRKSVAEIYDAMCYFDQSSYVRRGRFACTANAFTFAGVVLDVGGFDATFKSVADRVWGNAIADAGYALGFADDAVVYHPARRTVRELLRKRLRLAGGHHDLARKKGLAPLRLVNALCQQLVGNPLWALTQLARTSRMVGFRTALKVLGLYTFLCYAEGFERIRLQLGGRTHR